MIAKVRWKVASLLAVLALGGVALGCGDDDSSQDPAGEETTTAQEELSKQRYASELLGTMVVLGTDLQEIDTSAGPEDLDLSKAKLKQLGTTIRETVDEFGSIDPPGDAQEGHDRIQAALEDFSSKFTDVAETINSDGKVTEESFTALRTAIFELQDQYLQARETLIDAGVEMGTSQGGD